MIYRRYYIRAGASTSAGGIVRASSDYYIVDGAPLALEGDPVDCPACGTQGVIKCVLPRLANSFDGKECALSDDLCMCLCSPSPTLIADQDYMCQIFAVASVASAEEAMARSVSAMGATYDEQPRLIAPPIDGVHYLIETMDGRTFSGRTEANGLLPRIFTQAEEEYTVYWGDEALAKMKRDEG